MPTLEELEVRIAALEAKFKVDFEWFTKTFENDQDSVIARVDLSRRESTQIAVDAHDYVDRVAFELRAKVAERLQEAVDRLILESSSTVVAEALHKALGKTVLLVRNPTREETKSGVPVLAIRNATVAELSGRQ
jgi:hypothetical protein